MGPIFYNLKVTVRNAHKAINSVINSSPNMNLGSSALLKCKKHKVRLSVKKEMEEIIVHINVVGCKFSCSKSQILANLYCTVSAQPHTSMVIP